MVNLDFEKIVSIGGWGGQSFLWRGSSLKGTLAYSKKENALVLERPDFKRVAIIKLPLANDEELKGLSIKIQKYADLKKHIGVPIKCVHICESDQDQLIQWAFHLRAEIKNHLGNYCCMSFRHEKMDEIIDCCVKDADENSEWVQRCVTAAKDQMEKKNAAA